jgi:ketosteroid isomerase-like protein
MPKKTIAPQPQFATPAEVEAAFYEAIEQADLEGVMAVWAVDDEVVCIHPGGPRLDGYAAILEGWKQIFAHGNRLRFKLTDLNEHAGMTYAVHVLCEWVSDANKLSESTPVFATNAFTLTERGWRMILHHASAAPHNVTKPEESLPDLRTVVLH